MSDESLIRPARLAFVRRVTAKHGETFAEEWFKESRSTLVLVDAFATTQLVVWPEDDADAQERFKDIEDEIFDRIFAAARGAIGEAFVKAAREVLAWERKR